MNLQKIRGEMFSWVKVMFAKVSWAKFRGQNILPMVLTIAFNAYYMLWLQYQEDVDLGFPGGLVCALLLLLLMGGVQAVVLPRTKILLLLFLTAFIWVAVILILLLAVR